MTAPDLLPCPFCRGEAHIDGTSWRPSDGKEVAWVTCKGCGAYGPTLPEKEAIAAWNTRATPAAMTPNPVDDSQTADPAIKMAALVEALERIESITVHSGGEIHGVTALHWQTAFEVARDEAAITLAALRAGGDA